MILIGAQGIVDLKLIRTLVEKLNEELDEIKVKTMTHLMFSLDILELRLCIDYLSFYLGYHLGYASLLHASRYDPGSECGRVA